MTATFAPFGFEPVYTATDAGPTMYQNGIASGYSTSLYRGTPVQINASGNIVLATAGATNTIAGIFKGCIYKGPGDVVARFRPNWVAGTIYAGPMEVEIDTGEFGTLFRVQAGNADGSAGTAITQAAIGSGVQVASNIGAGNDYVGNSTTSIAASTLATSAATQQFTIVNIYQTPDNAWGDAAPVVLVRLNLQQNGLQPTTAAY